MHLALPQRDSTCGMQEAVSRLMDSREREVSASDLPHLGGFKPDIWALIGGVVRPFLRQDLLLVPLSRLQECGPIRRIRSPLLPREVLSIPTRACCAWCDQLQCTLVIVFILRYLPEARDALTCGRPVVTVQCCWHAVFTSA